MKVTVACALQLLLAVSVGASWPGQHSGGFDRGLRRPGGEQPTFSFGGHRRQPRAQPQQYYGHHPHYRQQRHQQHQAEQQRQQQHGDPHRHHPQHNQPPPPPPPSANDDFTSSFLQFAGEDVVLSSVELTELVHVASGEPQPPFRRSVLQILQQWDANRDGGLNLNEFLRMYAELQRQAPESFEHHWANLQQALPIAAAEDEQAAPPPPSQPSQRNPQQPPASEPAHDMSDGRGFDSRRQQSASPPDGSLGERFRPRNGRLNYIEKGQRFFELIYEDEDLEQGEGPLTVETIVSTRIVGQVDTWAESEVW